MHGCDGIPTHGSSNTKQIGDQKNLGLLGVGGASVDLLLSVHGHWPNDTLGHQDGNSLAREGGGDLLRGGSVESRWASV